VVGRSTPHAYDKLRSLTEQPSDPSPANVRSSSIWHRFFAVLLLECGGDDNIYTQTLETKQEHLVMMMEQFRHAPIRVQCALEPLARTIIIRFPACFICSELGDDTIYMHPRRVHSRHTRSALLYRPAS
jgi:hypothetical protein